MTESGKFDQTPPRQAIAPQTWCDNANAPDDEFERTEYVTSASRNTPAPNFSGQSIEWLVEGLDLIVDPAEPGLRMRETGRADGVDTA